MKSEFYDYINSTIFVNVSRDGVQKDGWGNAQPVQETLPIKAYLKESKRDSQGKPAGSVGSQQGANTFTTYLKGYLAEPMHWPENVIPEYCEVEYQGRRGKLQIYSQLPRAFNTEALTGDVVDGIATFQL
ncbi:hypothetical protein QT972_00215 [Microcoleus sp. herbarium7]|uniref:hypothetical protein n=1 Tax=Microcoleus sp. herbarium7 TaxID=3055435 RepID=UPI002FCF1603